MPRIEPDIVYAVKDGVELRLDIHHPDGEPVAAILLFHEGGWRHYTKAVTHPEAGLLAERGYLCLSVQYRLLDAAPWPAQIEDVCTALDWTRDHAVRLGVDPKRIILWGASAGGQLALLAALDRGDPPVAAVVAIYPPVRFDVDEPPAAGSFPARHLLGPDVTQREADNASPLCRIGTHFPPTMIVHGTADRLIDWSASRRLAETLEAIGCPVDVHYLHGHDHGLMMIPSVRAAIVAMADLFIRRTVVDPEGARAEALQYSIFARRP